VNDDRPDADEPRFDDPAHAWVQDLLASTRDTGAVPDDVAARLDATLASLRAERVGGADTSAADESGDGGGSAAVVPLRRRIAPFLAAAAAVLVVAGGAVGVTRLGGGGGSSNSSASSAGAASAEQGDRGSGAVKAPADRQSGAATAARALPRLTRAAFAADAAAVMRNLSSAGAAPDELSATTPGPTEASPPAVTGSTDQRSPASRDATAPPVTSTPGTPAMLAPVAAACPGPAVAGSVTVPATLDGEPVALVFRHPTAAAQRVEAWSCDGATLLASATVAH
jgi:hypothetical protein